ncbi:sigma-54-dependent Fis family transcriptional regulator [Rheinheimera mesophila]|uniref:Sigma-54-dependent Fis family transcriptional regulator n=1 Tax=Rheinheimera mesophila TaxID=1547515 RepID=A0A3P3QRM7_9GAMM|nr:sigma-54 dependent transcriptional regulator [Rheinheimera mesophila]KKL01070.1 Fis family transcriptional regulator [Rheinheimera mesophila]RRJ23179.1 sigma-54-dependent Fis family transcriptional regulator [Rheinheimera mesophila]
MQTTSILVVEDDAGLREALCDTLSLANYQVVPAQSAEQGLQLLKEHKISLVISDVQMGTMSGLDLLKTVKLNYPSLPVLMMTAYANVNDAVVAIRNGAVDYLAKPFSPEVLINMVSRYALGAEVATVEPVVHSEQGKQLVKLAAKVARSDANVLVLGPSGSGKEVLARYIHQQSGRADGPFVAINCAAIPENMLEATLFGYEKGAFTGAVQACPGKFEQAQQGTILLDEISEMDLNLQAKLLRVLQEREVERLGARKTIKLDVRVIATSNRDLKQAVAEGKFREDLYYRLNVFPLTWTALAERPADIVPLAMHLLERHCRSTGMPQPLLSYAAQQKLMQHYWPGNVRELDNIVQRALIICDGDQINAADILLESAPTVMDNQPELSGVQSSEADVSLFKSEIYEQEHRIILETMRACANSRKEVAERLGISARTLRYKLARMRESGIQLPA